MTGGQVVVGLFQVNFDSVKVPTSLQSALESDNSHLKFCNSNFHSACHQVCDFYIHLRNSNKWLPVSSLYIARLGRKQEENDAFKNEQRVRNGIKRKKAKKKTAIGVDWLAKNSTLFSPTTPANWNNLFFEIISTLASRGISISPSTMSSLTLIPPLS